MAIDYQRLLDWQVPDIEQDYSARDCMLYALGVGFGSDPLDAGQLRYVYEDDLCMVPSMPVVLGYPGFWMKDPATGVDWKRLVHGEQALRVHRLPPPQSRVIGRTRVTGINDKGAAKGALVYQRREVFDVATGELLATLDASTFCRGDGGCGGDDPSPFRAVSVPDRAPDHEVDLPTLPQSALLYRLNGDYNPLHADPQVAQQAGFERPILHGLATLGVACHALLRACCGYRAQALHALQVRFSAPVYPGETLRTCIWRDGDAVSFRSFAVERDIKVLDAGYAEVDG